jgi:hypothetical protein
MGKKVNGMKEMVVGENYLGIAIHRFAVLGTDSYTLWPLPLIHASHLLRFYFKCVNCWGEITFKTDPKNHDYVTESGSGTDFAHTAAVHSYFGFRCTRNFEPWRIAPEGAEPTSEMGNRFVVMLGFSRVSVMLKVTCFTAQSQWQQNFVFASSSQFPQELC